MLIVNEQSAWARARELMRLFAGKKSTEVAKLPIKFKKLIKRLTWPLFHCERVNVIWISYVLHITGLLYLYQ